MRKIPAPALALVAVVAIATPSDAMRIAFRPPSQRAINSEVVVVGKVTAIEKELVQAPPTPGAKDVGYKIAVVKIESGLVGAGKLQEIRVGFIPPPPKQEPNPKPVGGPVIRPRPGIQAPQLQEGQEMLLFLAKHPSGNFYFMPGMTPPVDLSTEQGKKEVEQVKRVAAILAEPDKSLKSEKPEVRSEAAAVMIMKYRSFPAFGGETELVALPLEESQTLLKALAEGEWSGLVQPGAGSINPIQGFHALGLTVMDGWVPPAIVPAQPGAPPIDFNAIQRDAFSKWLAGAGQKYQIKKVVPKAQK